MKDELSRKNISFKVIHADGIKREVDEILNFVSKYKINEVFINREYGCNERLRNENLNSELGEINVELNIFDSSIINPESIKTGTGNYFRVFTPYSKVFRAELTEKDLAILPEPLDQNLLVEDSDDIPNYELTDEHFLNAISKYPVGSETVINIFEQFVKDKVSDYKKLRDFPSLDSTSKLSPYLTSGMISAKYCLNKLLETFDDTPGTGQHAWMNEILWREFYKYIIFHFPRVSQNKSFSEKYDLMKWRDDEKDFQDWCKGRTGIPLIDAAMTQLNETGWMHNRLRMVVAMFLTKNLLIDWRRGEQYFMKRLIDGDHASNNGGWQWSASTGVDAAPYFRIFNPITQSEKFDKKGEFIKKFIPVLKDVPEKLIHNPPNDFRLNISYPKMIVDLKESRKRALEAFSNI